VSAPGQFEKELVRSYIEQNSVLVAKYSQWLEIQNYPYNTQRAYIGILADFCRFIGPQNILQVTHRGIRAYLEYLHARGLSPADLMEFLYHDV
jgi:site-specific recombinase XerD